MIARDTSIQCVAFDAVGTLIHPNRSIAETYQEIAHRYGCELSRQEIRHRFQTVMSSRDSSVPTSEDREKTFWADAVSKVTGISDPDCFHELYEYFATPEAWRLDPDASAIFRSLQARNLKYVLASNFDERLPRLVGALPGFSGFSDVIISSEIGWQKPNLRFFQALRERLQLPAQQILMVGNELESDILPAMQVGMQAVLLDPGASLAMASQSQERDVTVISSLRELFDRSPENNA